MPSIDVTKENKERIELSSVKSHVTKNNRPGSL